MNAKLKCSARIIGTPNGITLSKPEHNHSETEFPQQRIKIEKLKGEKLTEYITKYVTHE